MRTAERLLFLGFIIFMLCSNWACRKEELTVNPNDKLILRYDTLFFDTVFTQTSQNKPKSVNKQFTVVNPADKDIETRIILNNPNGFFRLNVDGKAGREFNNIKIRARDSLYIFVELYIDENNDPSSNPLIVRDSITFITNGNIQQTQLIAWGQDARYFRNDTLACNTIWDDVQKPYVIYGYVYVPPGCSFTIARGVKVHLAPYSWIYVEGTLKIEGTTNNFVHFEGDRLQPEFEEKAGQWGGIWLAWPSRDNSISHAVLKNGTVGIYCDTITANGKPNVVVRNTTIRNMLFDGIAGRMSHIDVQNSEIVNCGRYTFLGQWGGNYNVRHCTFATMNLDFSRRDPTFIFTNRQRDELGRVLNTFDFKADVRNCIVYGSQSEELGFDLEPSRIQDFYIGGSLLKTEDKSLGQAPLTNVLNKIPKFIDFAKQNYQLDTLSAAKDIGEILLPAVTTDYLDKSRDSKPDAGAFERFD